MDKLILSGGVIWRIQQIRASDDTYLDINPRPKMDIIDPGGWNYTIDGVASRIPPAVVNVTWYTDQGLVDLIDALMMIRDAVKFSDSILTAVLP